MFSYSYGYQDPDAAFRTIMGWFLCCSRPALRRHLTDFFFSFSLQLPRRRLHPNPILLEPSAHLQRQSSRCGRKQYRQFRRYRPDFQSEGCYCCGFQASDCPDSEGNDDHVCPDSDKDSDENAHGNGDENIDQDNHQSERCRPASYVDHDKGQSVFAHQQGRSFPACDRVHGSHSCSDEFAGLDVQDYRIHTSLRQKRPTRLGETQRDSSDESAESSVHSWVRGHRRFFDHFGRSPRTLRQLARFLWTRRCFGVDVARGLCDRRRRQDPFHQHRPQAWGPDPIHLLEHGQC